MLSVSLCSFFNLFFRGVGEKTKQLPVAQKKRVMKNRVGYVRIPGSIFSPIARFLTYELTLTSEN